MADVINPGQIDTLTAVYTMSDGTTTPADDATWSEDVSDAGILSTSSGSVVTFTPTDKGDGSTTPVNVTASGGGFSASVEIDVVASTPPAPTVTGISITSAVS